MTATLVVLTCRACGTSEEKPNIIHEGKLLDRWFVEDRDSLCKKCFPRRAQLPDVTRNFHGGNPQSEAANASLGAVKDVLRAQIVAFVKGCGARGATCDEIEVALNLSHQTASARITEAKQRHTLVPSGQQRATRSGRQAAVMVVP